MTAMDLEAERRMLGRLIGYHDDLNGYVWSMESDDGGTHIIAYREDGEVERIATIHKAARAEEIEVLCRALETLRFTLGMINRAKAKIREMISAGADAESRPQRETNYGFMAKSLCEKRLFWRFLEYREPLGRIESERAADTRLKGLLAIQSKADLNRDEKARAAFLSLRADYYRWKKGDG